MATVTLATPTLLSTLTTTIASSSAAASSSGAPPQGGILEGVPPNAYIPSNPIQLFIIQAGIIIIFCRLLHYPLSLVGQPRVIAEVIGGILLGPSVLARIPNFQDEIFPTASMPVLNNVANLGLLLFLFLIGLEVDIRMFTNNWRVALSVGIASMVLPFGLGFAIAWGLYHEFVGGATEELGFGTYGLFIGTALAITAFPVLCRILTELDMLGTPVGVTVLAAGVGNDVVGWVLLALCVALVNNGSGLTALWVLLVAVGWTLFLVFVVRRPFHWALRKTGSIQNGPTQGMVALTLLIVLVSAWFTNAIGVHAIFGAFLVGLICPHDGGFAIKLTEKIEDLITVLFLPLYFALSGLSTNLGLLNDGITWAYVIGVIACAFIGKIIGGTLAAKAMKLVWRESFSIGCLMSCKGLVELIVLNIGLQAGILDTKVFTIQKLEKWKRGEIDWDGKPLSDDDNSAQSAKILQDTRIRRLLVYLRLDSLPSLFTFISLLGYENTDPQSSGEKDESLSGTTEQQPVIRKRPLEVHALRILELTERTSSVMRVTDGDDYTSRDPVVNAFRTFSQLHDVAVSSNVAIAPESHYAQTVVTQASDQGSDFVLIPWSEVGSNTEDQSIPFKVSTEDRFSGRSHLDFIQATLSKAVCNTGIFIGNGFGGIVREDKRPALSRTVSRGSLRSQRETALPPIADKSHHIFLPYIGGADDRAALRFVLHLAKNPHVTVTIVNLVWAESCDEITVAPEVLNPTSPTESPKDAIDTESTAQDSSLLATMRASLPPKLSSRVSFTETTVTTKSAISQVMELAKAAVGQNPRNAGDIVIVGRRHPRLPTADRLVNQANIEVEVQRTIGILADRIVHESLKASVLVIQAAGCGLES
ncbi:hypothetical protein DL771_001710 [Monosporascus sp. 5C6A]|nr:hypothetical protein DL771_001710 [Monosporascus sp. 5C6A]